MTKDIPFSVGRSSGVPLSRQIADGIRSAIESGYYKPGQVLPTRKEFARTLGVSERVPHILSPTLFKCGGSISYDYLPGETFP